MHADFMPLPEANRNNINIIFSIGIKSKFIHRLFVFIFDSSTTFIDLNLIRIVGVIAKIKISSKL